MQKDHSVLSGAYLEKVEWSIHAYFVAEFRRTGLSSSNIIRGDRHRLSTSFIPKQEDQRLLFSTYY